MKGGDSLISPNQKTGASPLQSSEKQTGKIKNDGFLFYKAFICIQYGI